MAAWLGEGERGHEDLAAEADEVVCVRTPEPFYAVGLWYREFPQSTDEEVKRLLAAGYPRLFQICRCWRQGERGTLLATYGLRLREAPGG